MRTLDAATQGTDGAIAVLDRGLKALDRVPWDILALPMRIAGFSVFFRSGRVKIADWGATVDLFRTEYKVPVLPSEAAAALATVVELGGATLILLGLATRCAALAVLGMILVIQVFVYPEAWPDHVQWIAFLLPLLLWGPGRYSLDAAIAAAVLRRDKGARRG